MIFFLCFMGGQMKMQNLLLGISNKLRQEIDESKKYKWAMPFLDSFKIFNSQMVEVVQEEACGARQLENINTKLKKCIENLLPSESYEKLMCKVKCTIRR